MKVIKFLILILIFSGCNLFETSKPTLKLDLNRVLSVYYNDKADFFFGGYDFLAFPDTTFTIESIGDEFFLPKEKTANFNYQKFDPYQIFLFAEIKENGILFKAVNSIEKQKIKFDKLCQVFIVPNPIVTEIEIDKKLNLEEIHFTPRHNGSYQVTIGNSTRGCSENKKSSENIKRSKEYEMMINKINLK